MPEHMGHSEPRPEPTVHERDGWKWINRCPVCDAETFLEDDCGYDIWVCMNGHGHDMANQEVLERGQ